LKTNIVLIGYMGTGKTAVGQMLAEKLGRKFIELDWMIEEKAGRSIPEIFKEGGEPAFRELEIEAAKAASSETNAVIACGGGLILNKINTDRLGVNGVIVHLTASPNTILKRVSVEKGQRPLLEVEDQLKTIKNMLKFRKPFYKRAADITVNTSRLGISGVAGQIIGKLKEDESFSL
jgi:shikimate kinase